METKFDFIKKIILTIKDDEIDIFVGLIEKSKNFLTLTEQEKKIIDDILDPLKNDVK